MKHKLLLISAFISAMSFVNLAQAQTEPQRGGFDRNATAKLCTGKKIGQTINTKIGDRTVKGTCEIGFSATNPDTLPRGERGQNNPTAQVCNGKKQGQAVSVKVNGQTVNGKCELRLKMQRG